MAERPQDSLDGIIEQLYNRAKTIRFARGYAASDATIRAELKEAAKLVKAARTALKPKKPAADYRLQGAPKTQEQAEALTANLQRSLKTAPVCGEHFKFMGWTCVLHRGHLGTHSRVPLKKPTTQQEFYEEFIAQGMSESEARTAAKAWTSAGAQS